MGIKGHFHGHLRPTDWGLHQLRFLHLNFFPFCLMHPNALCSPLFRCFVPPITEKPEPLPRKIIFFFYILLFAEEQNQKKPLKPLPSREPMYVPSGYIIPAVSGVTNAKHGDTIRIRYVTCVILGGHV